MKRILYFVPVILLLAGIAAAQDVRYNYDQNADFTKYKTYKMVEHKSSDKDELIDKQIRATIEAELANKGLTKSDSDSADLYVAYQFSISTEKQVDTWNTGYGYGGGWRRYGGMGTTTGTATTSTLYIGSLQLDFYEVPSKNTVYRTIASKTIDQKAKPDKQQKNLTKAVQKMLKEYPPKPKK